MYNLFYFIIVLYIPFLSYLLSASFRNAHTARLNFSEMRVSRSFPLLNLKIDARHVYTCVRVCRREVGPHRFASVTAFFLTLPRLYVNFTGVYRICSANIA